MAVLSRCSFPHPYWCHWCHVRRVREILSDMRILQVPCWKAGGWMADKFCLISGHPWEMLEIPVCSSEVRRCKLTWCVWLGAAACAGPAEAGGGAEAAVQVGPHGPDIHRGDRRAHRRRRRGAAPRDLPQGPAGAGPAWSAAGSACTCTPAGVLPAALRTLGWWRPSPISRATCIAGT